MSIFFQLCNSGGDVVNDPEIKLTDYTIKDINWITSSVDHDLEGALHKSFDYMIEIKGEIISENTNNTEEDDVKKLINWVLAPENSKEVYKNITIEIYRGGEVEDIKDIEPEKRIRNDAIKDAYVVAYNERYPDKEMGGKGTFSIVFREKLKDEYKIEAIKPPKPDTNNTENSGKSFSEKRYVGAEGGLKFRKEAGVKPEHDEDPILPYGSEVYWDGNSKVYKDNYSWVKVQVGEKVGWVASEFLKTELEKKNFDLVGTGEFVWPTTEKRITNVFSSSHNGIDISGDGKIGNPVFASLDGTVELVKYDSGNITVGGGYYIKIKSIDNGNKIETWYMHLIDQSATVKVGELVSAGQIIAKLGNTGESTGPHLHFRVHINGERVDPSTLNYRYRERN